MVFTRSNIFNYFEAFSVFRSDKAAHHLFGHLIRFFVRAARRFLVPVMICLLSCA